MTDRLSPQLRSLRARQAAFVLHSRYDSVELTQAAREAFLARFLVQADPDQLLPSAERQRRARCLLKAHMARLAYRSAAARSRKAAA